ncbi:MAG: hypothetical protein R3B70_08770 [Polyangiaceae bacterium]
MGRRQATRRQFLLEVDGPNVSPETVDASRLLELAAATFALLHANARGAGLAISLRGIEVHDKCVAIASNIERTGVIRDIAKKVAAQIDGTEDAPPGLQTQVERARAARRALDGELRASLHVGTWKRELGLEHESPPTQPLDSILSIRAVPIRAGGVQPVVRFRSSLEDEFTLRVTREQARAIGGLLYQQVDLEARVARGPEGAIVDGKLEHFDRVEAGDAEAAWRDWYYSVGGREWDQHPRD